MTRPLLTYAATTAMLMLLDALWLGLLAKPLYQQGIGHLMAAQPRLGVAAAFYLLYPLGLVIFAVWPGAVAAGWGEAAWRGALFGLFAYATYDLTNLATLRDWPVGLSLLDVAWGMVVSAAAATAGRMAFERLA